ncbi:MAG TPA: hypothetical protein VEB41_03405 [Burkholderiales bacterium]|nr:hypothetical protein [Burkholderiales bacterium]
MKLIPLLFALLFASSAAAQSRTDNAPERPPNDPAEKSRIRTDGAAGGTGDPVARGDRVRSGQDAEASHRKGRKHDEGSSDRKAGRGADARSR